MARKKAAPHQQILAFALSLPGAFEDHPWGETVAKVGKKVFLFLGKDPTCDFGIGVKLPVSGPEILKQSFAQPAGYGLGKHGWVNLRFQRDEPVPVDLLCECIVESYKAVAPKKLTALVDAEAMPQATNRGKTTRRRT
jgi:predicted DNA-binding protein (MmcQ/YjbR family)